MKIKDLMKQLKQFPEDADVILELKIDGVEFDASVDEIYESGDSCYLYGVVPDDFGSRFKVVEV